VPSKPVRRGILRPGITSVASRGESRRSEPPSSLDHLMAQAMARPAQRELPHMVEQAAARLLIYLRDMRSCREQL
jgi:hypothetical protein